MKKIISALILIALVFMLEFNLLEPLLPDIHVWIESITAFAVLILLILWNDQAVKKQ